MLAVELCECRPAAVYKSEIRIGDTDMWLPKDERKMLVYYFSKIGQVEKKERFDTGSLAEYLQYGMNPKGSNIKPDEMAEACREHISYLQKLKVANETIRGRGLIDLAYHGTCTDTIEVKLNIEGYDLGRKYSHWILRSQLWFMQYGKHWIFLGLGWIISLFVMWWLSRGK